MYLPEFKRGDDHIKYIWAKEIFHYAFKISKPPLTTGDLVAGSEKFHAAYYLSECEQTYLEKGGVILDIPWESKYHERSPYLYSVFYRHRKWNLTRDNLLNLTADDKVTDGWLRGKIIEAIKYQLDDTMERLDGMMS
ncbi:MAG: hypothetical protein O7C75_01280 [Verrucomicrobia bacterium]|nr:hypothetical protein [Verrucomicrobiota bacterium]